ncbi:MAG: hypothetical protein WA110_03365 [Anaerolineaceae bacterium]
MAGSGLSNDEKDIGMENHPELIFFCELDAQSLKKLFEDRFVLDDLKSLNAGVSLGMLDFSDERAQAVQKLNKLDIPVTAWLLLPKDQGYWFNLENTPQAIARYEVFKQWSQRKKLKWAGIGLDIEPDINQIQALFRQDREAAASAIKRLKDKNAYEQATLAYNGLVNQIHQDGYEVEAYHLPVIADERKARSSVLKRAAGLVDVPVDRDVLMLYSSFSRPRGQALLWQYAQDADAIGIGNTGGGVEMEGAPETASLSWEEFSTDLHLAWRTGKPVYVFSLEGCVRQGFLDRLITFDWNAPVEIPATGMVKVGRGGLRGALWLGQRPWVGFAALAGLIGGVAVILGRKRRK